MGSEVERAKGILYKTYVGVFTVACVAFGIITGIFALAGAGWFISFLGHLFAYLIHLI